MAVISKKIELQDPLVRLYLPMKFFPSCLCVLVGFVISNEPWWVLTGTSSLYLLLKMTARATCSSCGWPGPPVGLRGVLSMFSLSNSLYSFYVWMMGRPPAMWLLQSLHTHTCTHTHSPEIPLNNISVVFLDSEAVTGENSQKAHRWNFILWEIWNAESSQWWIQCYFVWHCVRPEHDITDGEFKYIVLELCYLSMSLCTHMYYRKNCLGDCATMFFPIWISSKQKQLQR